MNYDTLFRFTMPSAPERGQELSAVSLRDTHLNESGTDFIYRFK